MHPFDETVEFATDSETFSKIFDELGLGHRLKGAWSIPEIWPLTIKGQKKRAIHDAPDLSTIRSFSMVPLLSQTAKNAIAPLLLDDAEWLECRHSGATYWLLNIIRTIDAVDTAESKIDYGSNGDIIQIDSVKIKPETIGDAFLFKFSIWPRNALATEAFVDAIGVSKLVDFHFSPIWDSSHPPFSQHPTRAEIRSRPEIYGPDGIRSGFESAWPSEWKS